MVRFERTKRDQNGVFVLNIENNKKIRDDDVDEDKAKGRVSSGNFGHQVNSDMNLQTMRIQMSQDFHRLLI